ERDVDRLLRAKEPGCDSEIDTEVGELCAELARLLPSVLGQRDRTRRITAQRVGDVRLRLGVSRKDEQPSGSTQPRSRSTPPPHAHERSFRFLLRSSLLTLRTPPNRFYSGGRLVQTAIRLCTAQPCGKGLGRSGAGVEPTQPGATRPDRS